MRRTEKLGAIDGSGQDEEDRAGPQGGAAVSADASVARAFRLVLGFIVILCILY